MFLLEGMSPTTFLSVSAISQFDIADDFLCIHKIRLSSRISLEMFFNGKDLGITKAST